MLAIKEALERLNGAITNLDEQVGHMETTLSGQQRDMFAAPAAPAGKGMAKRIDRAIQQVEKLLEEA